VERELLAACARILRGHEHVHVGDGAIPHVVDDRHLAPQVIEVARTAVEEDAERQLAGPGRGNLRAQDRRGSEEHGREEAEGTNGGPHARGSR
jgi:hypothetical protein